MVSPGGTKRDFDLSTHVHAISIQMATFCDERKLTIKFTTKAPILSSLNVQLWSVKFEKLRLLLTVQNMLELHLIGSYALIILALKTCQVNWRQRFGPVRQVWFPIKRATNSVYLSTYPRAHHEVAELVKQDPIQLCKIE